MFPCERKSCGHPLAFHDPCSKCGCKSFKPQGRKDRVRRLTDVTEIKSAEQLAAEFMAELEAKA